jgi:hypothetical protein
MARCGKKRRSQAFSARDPHSAPIREMASCGLALEENAGFGDFDPVMARCGRQNGISSFYQQPASWPDPGPLWPGGAAAAISVGQRPSESEREETQSGDAPVPCFGGCLYQPGGSLSPGHQGTRPPPPANCNWRRGSYFPRKTHNLNVRGRHLAERGLPGGTPTDDY